MSCLSITLKSSGMQSYLVRINKTLSEKTQNNNKKELFSSQPLQTKSEKVNEILDTNKDKIAELLKDVDEKTSNKDCNNKIRELRNIFGKDILENTLGIKTVWKLSLHDTNKAQDKLMALRDFCERSQNEENVGEFLKKPISNQVNYIKVLPEGDDTKDSKNDKLFKHVNHIGKQYYLLAQNGSYLPYGTRYEKTLPIEKNIEQKKLGAGNFGEVYERRDPYSQFVLKKTKNVAINLPNIQFFNKLAEAIIVNNLTCINSGIVIDSSNSKNPTEYNFLTPKLNINKKDRSVEDISLETITTEYLQEKNLHPPLKKLLTQMRELAKLGFHTYDLNLENIVLTSDNKFVLIDFGLAYYISPDKKEIIFSSSLGNHSNISMNNLITYIEKKFKLNI